MIISCWSVKLLKLPSVMLTHVCGTNNWWAKGLPGVGVVNIFRDSHSSGWKSFRLRLHSPGFKAGLHQTRRAKLSCESWFVLWSREIPEVASRSLRKCCATVARGATRSHFACVSRGLPELLWWGINRSYNSGEVVMTMSRLWLAFSWL